MTEAHFTITITPPQSRSIWCLKEEFFSAVLRAIKSFSTSPKWATSLNGAFDDFPFHRERFLPPSAPTSLFQSIQLSSTQRISNFLIIRRNRKLKLAFEVTQEESALWSMQSAEFAECHRHSVPESAESNKSLSPITPGIWKTFSVERQTRAGARSMRSINALRNMNLCSWWCRKTRQSDGRRGFIGLKYPIFLFSLVFVYDLRRWEMERFRAICFVRWDYRCERDGVGDVSRREAWKWVR